MKNNFEDLFNRIRAWQIETFGPNIRGPQGPLNHLKKEIDEVLSKPDDLEEYADMMFLVIDAVYRGGFTISEFYDMIEFKLQKNKERDWPDWREVEDINAPIFHIK